MQKEIPFYILDLYMCYTCVHIYIYATHLYLCVYVHIHNKDLECCKYILKLTQENILSNKEWLATNKELSGTCV